MKATNGEQLSLYYAIGGYVSTNTRDGFWGTGALSSISERLQKKQEETSEEAKAEEAPAVNEETSAETAPAEEAARLEGILREEPQVHEDFLRGVVAPFICPEPCQAPMSCQSKRLLVFRSSAIAL